MGAGIYVILLSRKTRLQRYKYTQDTHSEGSAAFSPRRWLTEVVSGRFGGRVF